jgi:hypothetical protein
MDGAFLPQLLDATRLLVLGRLLYQLSYVGCRLILNKPVLPSKFRRDS